MELGDRDPRDHLSCDTKLYTAGLSRQPQKATSLSVFLPQTNPQERQTKGPQKPWPQHNWKTKNAKNGKITMKEERKGLTSQPLRFQCSESMLSSNRANGSFSPHHPSCRAPDEACAGVPEEEVKCLPGLQIRFRIPPCTPSFKPN